MSHIKLLCVYLLAYKSKLLQLLLWYSIMIGCPKSKSWMGY